MSNKQSFLLAILSGIITGLVFPTMFGKFVLPNLGFLAWFSLIPLFVVIYNQRPRKTFLLTFIAGCVYFSISLYWLYNALSRYGGLPPYTSVGVLFLLILLQSFLISIGPFLVSIIRSKIKIPALILLPVAWVAAELLRNYFPFGGFSWNNLAYSQAGYPEFIQTADIFGIYGIVFLIVVVNQFFAELIIGWGKASRLHLGIKFVSVFVLFSLFIAYGWYSLETIEKHSPTQEKISVALVQGNIPQENKWDQEYLEGNLKQYSNYMKLIANSNIRLAVWPESSYPFLVPLTVEKFRHETLGLKGKGAEGPWVLFGAISKDGMTKKNTMYNSAILVDNDGYIFDRYHKKHLVPFGEYVPLRKLLFFAEKLVANVGDFIPGKKYRAMEVDGYKVGPLICYEDVFPEIARLETIDGANILVNMTNDAWYGWTSAARQHLAMSIFRAVENRRYMLRATNTGISAVIDSRGIPEITSDMFVQSFIATSVPLLSGLTIYDKIGDLFAYICAFVLVGALIFTLVYVLKCSGRTLCRPDKRKNACQKS